MGTIKVFPVSAISISLFIKQLLSAKRDGLGAASMNKTHSSVTEFTIFGGREKLTVIISEMSDRKER